MHTRVIENYYLVQSMCRFHFKLLQVGQYSGILKPPFFRKLLGYHIAWAFIFLGVTFQLLPKAILEYHFLYLEFKPESPFDSN